MEKKIIKIQGSPVRMEKRDNGDYICITDIAKSGVGNHQDIVRNYLRNGNNVAFLKLWEELYGRESFNSTVADVIKSKTADNNYSLSVKMWIEQTNAIGIDAIAGRYGGTYVHKDIAVHFSTWMSPEAYLYMVKEFQRLKEEEAIRLEKIESTKNWIFEKVMRNADELNSVAQLGLEISSLEEEE
jgi:hypothetical protein